MNKPPCCMCARVIDPRDIDAAHCFGCGAYVCPLCTHRIVWEFEAEPVAGRHCVSDHATQAKELGIEALAGSRKEGT